MFLIFLDTKTHKKHPPPPINLHNMQPTYADDAVDVTADIFASVSSPWSGSILRFLRCKAPSPLSARLRLQSLLYTVRTVMLDKSVGRSWSYVVDRRVSYSLSNRVMTSSVGWALGLHRANGFGSVKCAITRRSLEKCWANSRDCFVIKSTVGLNILWGRTKRSRLP